MRVGCLGLTIVLLFVAPSAGADKPTRAERLILKFGGVLGSIPFFAFLDPNGELIINSRRPVKNETDDGNSGFPAQPYEINWFLIMLKKGAPAVFPDDARVIETSLRGQ